MLALRAGDVIEVSQMGVFWRSWWLGGLAGGLVVVPLALAWAHARRSLWRGRRAGEGALMLAAVAGLSGIALSADQPLTYIVFPAFIWAALRLGPQGATLAVAVAAVIAVLATSNQLGPFVEHSPTDSALNLQLYIIFAALTTCCLAAIVANAATRRWSWPSRIAARVSAPPWSDSASPATCTIRSPSRCSPPRCTYAPRSTRWSSRSSIPPDRLGRS
jgi:integral membrane sensor domain MASE1